MAHSFDFSHVPGYIDPALLFAGLEKIMAEAPAMMFMKDANLRYVAATPEIAVMAGKSSVSELLGKTSLEAFEDKTVAMHYTADDEQVLASNEDLIDFIEPLHGENGEVRYASASKYILRDSDGNVTGILGILRDITQQMKARQKYQQTLKYLFSLPEDTYSAILIDVDAWRIIDHQKSESLRDIMPIYTSLDQFRSDVLRVISDKNSEAYHFYEDFSAESLKAIYDRGRNEYAVEHRNLPGDGYEDWTRDEWRFFLDPDNGHLNAMLLVQDIDRKKQEEVRLLQAARIDELTGVLNRATVKQEVETYLCGEGAKGIHAVFMIDLDDFKLVNDTFGHQAGDRLLHDVATSIKSCFRDLDLVGRIGGDEFLVFAKNMPSPAIVRSRAKRLLDVVRKVYAEQTTAIGSISVGVSKYPQDGKTLDELYQKADEALYRAKNTGKNRASFASDEAVDDWRANAFDRQYEAYNSQVMDHSSSLCYIADMETHELLHMTKGAMALYGLTDVEQYRGKKCHQLIMGEESPCSFCPNSKLVKGTDYRWERYSEKLCKWFDHISSIIHLDGRPCHLEIAHDISDRKEEVSVLSGRLSMEDVLFRCLHTLSSETSTELAFRRFLEAIGGYYQGSRTYIFEFDLENSLVNNTFEWCAEGISAEIDQMQRIPLKLVDGLIKKFRADGEFSISSLEEDLDPGSDEYRILEIQGIRSLIAAPLWTEGQISGFIGVDDPIQNQGDLTLLRSVSEFVQAELVQRRLSDDLAAALKKAELANLSKSKFLFNMSHDIRTPMNAILGFSMMARNHIDDKERVLDGLSKLDSAGKHLLRLINDVLDMSRIESGKMTFDLQPHHLPSILKDTEEMFSPEMQKKDITFTVSCEVEDEFVLIDRLRMDQVELNLISNALKYTPEGGKVDYTLRQLGPAQDGFASYQISIKDNGIGMSPEFVARVFEPFEREQSSTVSGIQGTGLGLSIVKSLLDQMGGSISCHSELGVGTEFVVTVTCETITEADMPKKVEELSTKSSFTERRILLVEDNELNREIAVEILQEFGFIMESAEDGDIAVDMVKASTPGYYDLVLMDIQMPRMDGYAATKAIRALEDKALAGVPIIAMTANAFAEDRLNAMVAGMNEHIAKPIDVPKLLEMLQRIL